LHSHNHESIVFVYKWVQTKHAIFFHLTNGLIQANFKDRSQIIMLKDRKFVYVDVKLERRELTLDKIPEYEEKIRKRPKHTKDL
jgi:hypothetical protein